MTVATDLVAALQALANVVGATAADPAERTRLMMALAATPAVPGGNPSIEALGRRAALAELARASAEVEPRSYDEAVSLRDAVCALLDAGELEAADAFEDDVAAAIRDLSGAVYRDLSRRGASLAPLRDIDLQATMPSLVLAQRLYGDATREAEMVRMAGDPPHPCFMPRRFRALAR